jgi:hypothetical protein
VRVETKDKKQKMTNKKWRRKEKFKGPKKLGMKEKN